MGFRSKVDALDFVIRILITHEKALDNIVERLENVTQEIENMIMKEKYDSVQIRIQEVLTEMLGKTI